MAVVEISLDSPTLAQDSVCICGLVNYFRFNYHLNRWTSLQFMGDGGYTGFALSLRDSVILWFCKAFRWKFSSHFSQELWCLQSWNLDTCGQWVDVSCIPQSGCYLLFVPLFIFLSLQFSNIKIFHHTFLRNCEAYKVEIWYMWTLGGCIVYTGTMLLPLINPFIVTPALAWVT